MSTRQAALYLRQSRSDTEGIDRQIERTSALADARGWAVVERYIDDDVSASVRRGSGTAWSRMLADANSGKFDVVIGVDLDRVLRTTRDLNTLIDHGLALVTVDGEIDLSTADGEFRATMLAGIARFEVRRKGERQRRANAQRREAGHPPAGSTRLTGYTDTMKPHPTEAPVVGEIFERFIAGESMMSIAQWLDSGVMASRNGRPWLGSTIRIMLKNPRYCGRQTYRRLPTGHMGNWAPIVSEATFDTVQAVLNDPRRLTRKDKATARKHLGSGLFRCWACDLTVRVHGSASRGGNGSYGCPKCHLTRSRQPVDEYVTEVVKAWLSQLDLDLSPYLDEAANPSMLPELRRRLAKVEEDYDSDLIDAQRYSIKRAKIEAEIELEAASHRRSRASAAVGEVIGSRDPSAAFGAAPLGIQRMVIDEFLVVRLKRGKIGGGKNRFDPATVEIEWRRA